MEQLIRLNKPILYAVASFKNKI